MLGRRVMSTKKQNEPPPPAARRVRLLLITLIFIVVVLNWVLWQFASRPSAAGRSSNSSSLSPYQPEPDKLVYGRYAGSKACQECHAPAFANWAPSHHALAERPLDPWRDQAAFAPARVVKHGTQSSEVRLAKGRFELEALSEEGKRLAFPVERVVGHDPLRQCLVPMPGGRYQVTELAFDPARSEWFDIFGEEDRRPGEWGHWTGRGMTWNVMCAACHNTRLRKHYQPATDTYATTRAEMAVGCEGCHGPMADHVAWQQKHPSPPSPPSPPPRPKDPTLRPFTRDQWLDVCGSCHARRAELTGDYVAGEAFFDHHSLSIPDETDIYYPDGQVKEENYEFTSFLGSRMYAAGVRCWDCHEIHSAKVPTLENLLCMRCHNGTYTNAPVINAAAHSFHKPGTPGDRCVDCHMPLTSYMQRHLRRDHGYTIPDPLLTKQYQVPNACGRCHKDKPVDWSLAAVEKWYGPRMERHTRARAQVLAQARAGQPAVWTNLLQLARAEPIPLWRAVATGLLKPWCDDPAVYAALVERASDTNALVRATAVRAFEPLAAQQNTNLLAVLGRLLEDPARWVRVEAAWAMRAHLDTNSVAGRDLLYYLDHNADMPSAMLQKGVFFLDRGEAEAALQLFRKAVSWDAGSAPLRHGLAVALSVLGKTEEAVRELEAACRLAPQDAEMRFKLGLALNEAARPREALAALEAAVKLDARFAKAWYNLGLAYSAQELPERALEALTKAESLSPSSPQIPYARATILVRLQKTDEARAAARRALELQPGYTEALVLLQMLEGK
jgi:tetratricopeptide (TPR) repeat protein